MNYQKTVSKTEDIFEKVHQFSKKTHLLFLKNTISCSRKLFVAFFLLLSSYTAFAQEKTITGTVSYDGAPLMGVSVLVKGSDNGTITNEEGVYSLSGVASTDILSFVFLGMKTQEIAVGSQTKIDVVLEDDISFLDEVVVVGYGEQKSKNVTGAVSVVGKEDLELRPNTQVAPLIYGKTAGVVVTPSSGQPGQGISLNIRGTSSLGSSDPLYVVDGVITVDTRTINPADIESISILKDASSAAIYGAQGANGVVLITTKLGKSSKPTINFNTYVGFTEVGKRIDVLNSRQYQDLMADLGFNTIWSQFPHNTDWQEEIFQQGLIQNHQLSISGRTEKTRYYLSGSHMNEVGAVRSSEAIRTNFRLNIDQEINDWFKVGARVSYNNYSDVSVNDNSPANRSGVLLGALVTPSVINVFNDDGTFTANPFQDWENPLASTDGNDRGYKSRQFSGNAFVEISFLKDFTFKSNLGIEQKNGEYTEFIDPFRTSFGRAIQGRGVSNIDKYEFSSFDNLLTYKKSIDDHNIEVSAGIISQYFLFEDQWLTTTSFAGDQITTAGAGSIVENFGAFKSEKRNLSYISRVNYSFKDKYLVTLNFRRDGSSVFGPDERFGFFPSASVGWRVSDEKFLANKDWLKDMKLRVGWGVNGNDPISPYAYLGLTGTGADYGVNGQILPGIFPSTIENNTLKWEETTQLNFGVDFSLFDGRISSSIDIYDKQTTDVLLGNIPIPTSSGFSSATGNAMEIQNRGFEFLLNTINVDSSVKWTSNLNFTINRNKVLASRVEEVPGGFITNRGASTITRVGQPLSLFYGHVFAGVDPANGRAQYLTADNQLTYTPDEDDRRIIGNPHPDVVYGFTNTVTYKGFSLSVFLQGSEGNDMINATRFDTESMNSPSNQSATVLRRWRQPGDITDVPGISQIGNTENSILSTRFVEDASYLRVKTLTLSYSLPTSLLDKIHVKGLTVYATGENLLTFTDYSGYDPEVNTFGGDALSTGIDYGTFPQTRRVIFGMNLTL